MKQKIMLWLEIYIPEQHLPCTKGDHNQMKWK